MTDYTIPQVDLHDGNLGINMMVNALINLCEYDSDGLLPVLDVGTDFNTVMGYYVPNFVAILAELCGMDLTAEEKGIILIKIETQVAKMVNTALKDKMRILKFRKHLVDNY